MGFASGVVKKALKDTTSRIFSIDAQIDALVREKEKLQDVGRLLQDHLISVSHEEQISREFNGGKSGPIDWSRDNFPWSLELRTKMKNVFGISRFRTNQQEVINATMSGKDVFVIMPVRLLLLILVFRSL